MKLLFINQYYWPDYAATAQMMGDLCERLVEAGHEVHVLCSRGKYDEGTRAGERLPRYEQHRGVHIHRVSATGFGKRLMVGRTIDYLSFHTMIGLNTWLRGWRYDVVVTLTTPPLVGVYATLLKLCGIKHIAWAMDLHPDCEFELGVFSRRNSLARMFDWLNGMHFRWANATVALGDDMKQRLLDKGVKNERLQVIPVWGHDLPEPSSDAVDQMRKDFDVEGKFVVMYSGNAGLIHTFDSILEAARRLSSDDRFAFLFVGGGGRRAEIEAFKQKHDLRNIILRDYVPREQLAASLAVGDVHLVTLRDNMAGVASPCKLYGIFAACKPVIFIGPEQCTSADVIRQANAGRCLRVDDVDGLVDALAALAESNHERKHLARNARQAFEDQYNADRCCTAWRELIDETG